MSVELYALILGLVKYKVVIVLDVLVLEFRVIRCRVKSLGLCASVVVRI